MLESCAFIGTKPKQILYLIMARHSTVTFGVTAFKLKVLLLPLVLYLVQVFVQVLGLLLWLLLTEELQKYSWQSSEKQIRQYVKCQQFARFTGKNTGRKHELVNLYFTEKQKWCTNLLNTCFSNYFSVTGSKHKQVLRPHCYPLFFKAQTC